MPEGGKVTHDVAKIYAGPFSTIAGPLAGISELDRLRFVGIGHERPDQRGKDDIGEREVLCAVTEHARHEDPTG